MARRAFLVATALLCITAGCSAPTPTVEVPENASLPPGLSTDGVTNINSLVGAHTDALRNRSFTVRRTTVIEGKHYRLVVNQTWRLNASGRLRGTLRVEAKKSGNPPRWATKRPNRTVSWREGTTVYRRAVTDDGPRYEAVSLFNTSVTISDALHRNILATFNDGQRVSIRTISRDGKRLYRIAGEPATGDVERTELLVSPSGLVKTIQTERTLGDSDSQTVRIEVEITEVGTTTVRRPDWYRTAVNATSASG